MTWYLDEQDTASSFWEQKFDYQEGWNYFHLLALWVHKVTILGNVSGRYKFESHSTNKDLMTKTSMQ